MTDKSNRADQRRVQYVVISPVRDEAEYLETTIQSMIRQTVRPAEWILVNDGSTDKTADIIDRWAAQYSWIRSVHRANRDVPAACGNSAFNPDKRPSGRGFRAREAKEIEAFYGGYEELSFADWEYLAKIDGDVGFEPDYFERCFAEFEADSHLGIGGGDIWNLVDGKLQAESTPRFHVRGATKVYRRRCWESIGGIVRGAGWDTLDEVKANMLGWRTRSFDHLKVIHFRFTGAANGAWQNAVKNGVWSYIAGYHPLFMASRCANRLFKKPCLLGSLGLFYGYVQGYLLRVPQTEDKELIRYLRNQQMRRLSFRKSIWD